MTASIIDLPAARGRIARELDDFMAMPEVTELPESTRGLLRSTWTHGLMVGVRLSTESLSTLAGEAVDA